MHEHSISWDLLELGIFVPQRLLLHDLIERIAEQRLRLRTEQFHRDGPDGPGIPAEGLDLVAHGREVEEVCKLIGADGLIFQDLEDLEEAVREINPELRHFETSVFNGHYVTSDVDQGYLDHLNALRSDDNKAVREWQEGTSNLEIFNEGS